MLHPAQGFSLFFKSFFAVILYWGNHPPAAKMLKGSPSPFLKGWLRHIRRAFLYMQMTKVALTMIRNEYKTCIYDDKTPKIPKIYIFTDFLSGKKYFNSF